MVKKPKIVIIGAGSVCFGLSCLRDAIAAKELWGGTQIVLVDLKEEALVRMLKLAECMNREYGAGYEFSAALDRREALPGADFVITSIAINRNELWKQDFLVPKKYGINHVLGENGGPGSVFHTMRNIPIILDICRDMEKLSPNALLINFTNPESRICLAVKKYSSIKAIGLCHQIGEGIRIVSRITGRNYDDIDVKAFGLNHFTWFRDIRDKRTGEDLYPLLEKNEKDFDPEFEKLSRYMYHRFGLFPTPGDGHLGEYLPYAHELTGTEGYDFEQDERNRINSAEFIKELCEGKIPLDSKLNMGGYYITPAGPSGEKAFDIIKGIACNSNELIEAVNVPNDGYITNLPADAVVEVPAIASGNGIIGLGMGALPWGISALCTNQINVQHLVVDAGATGNKDLAMQALLVDPNVPSAMAAERIFAELMEINRPYLPQFQ